MSRRLRVVQWTTGKTGKAAVRGMVGHPVLDLVGCFAYSSDKAGGTSASCVASTRSG